jgi:hypothetical protein
LYLALLSLWGPFCFGDAFLIGYYFIPNLESIAQLNRPIFSAICWLAE